MPHFRPYFLSSAGNPALSPPQRRIPGNAQVCRVSARKKARASVEARIASEVEKQIFVESLFPARNQVQFTPNAYHIGSLHDVEDVADKLRTSWELGFDPANNVTSMLEDHGVKVVMIDGIDGFDGFSCIANGNIPVMAIPAGITGDRQRFALAWRYRSNNFL